MEFTHYYGRHKRKNNAVLQSNVVQTKSKKYQFRADTELINDKCIDITSREMIPQDFEQIHKYRLQVTYYNDWDILINEERAYGFNDDDFINDLITFSKEHPLFKQTEIEFTEEEA